MDRLEKELTDYMLDNLNSGTPKSIVEAIKYFVDKGYEVKDIHVALTAFSSKHIACNSEELD